MWLTSSHFSQALNTFPFLVKTKSFSCLLLALAGRLTGLSWFNWWPAVKLPLTLVELVTGSRVKADFPGGEVVLQFLWKPKRRYEKSGYPVCIANTFILCLCNTCWTSMEYIELGNVCGCLRGFYSLRRQKSADYNCFIKWHKALLTMNWSKNIATKYILHL